MYSGMREALDTNKEIDHTKYTGDREDGIDGEEQVFDCVEAARCIQEY